VTFVAATVWGNNVVWPPPPDPPRVEYLGEIDFGALKPASNWLGRLVRLIGGDSPEDQLSLPFDVVASDGNLFVVCQNVAALVEIDSEKRQFKLHRCKEKPMQYPVSVCSAGGDRLLVSDPEAAVIYLFDNGSLRPLITSGLERPTGISALPELGRIYVVDTGDHTLKLFDLDGQLVASVAGDSNDSTSLHYPTFATTTSDNELLVNDALNYKIRRFDAHGRHLSAFGDEGSGPGFFARPKGLAVDSEEHLYVVDNLFDNVQVFDSSGRLLLVIGGQGSLPGQFWSPAGIDIVKDTIYVADTFNDRIQILKYLGGTE
jgi:DNA-binding beta-propeller fold protein YncE